MPERKHNLHSHYERLGDQITGPVLGSIVIHPRSQGRADGGTLPPGPAGYPAVAHGQDPPLPRRTVGNAPGGARIPQHPHSADLRWKPPNPDLLRRLLAGLKRLG
jgi:hypothetical protein